MRYEDVEENVVKKVEEIAQSIFPQLFGANIKVVYDTKKKMDKGRISIARIKKLNEENKFLAMDNSGFTYDYMIFIDKNIWIELNERDKERIIFHELCHTKVLTEKDDPWSLKDHEIQGFYDELDYNIDDPRWSERISVIAESVYDKDKDGGDDGRDESGE